MAEEQTKEYKPNYVKEPGYEQPILGNVGKSRELATVDQAIRTAEEWNQTEAKVALETAEAGLESKWKQEDVLEGLKPEEKKMYDVMDGLLKMEDDSGPVYKDAFVQKVDSKGRRYLILHPTIPGEPQVSFKGQIIFLSKDGLFSMSDNEITGLQGNEDRILDFIDWDKIGDGFEQPTLFPEGTRRRDMSIPLSSEWQTADARTVVNKFNLEAPEGRSAFKVALKDSQKKGENLKIDAEKKKVSATTILTDLY